MTVTAFKKVTDNAVSVTNTDLTLTGVTSIVLATGTGSKYPATGSFRVDLWNGPASSDPVSDPNYEQVIASARSGDTVTIAATAKTHTTGCNVMLPVDSQDVTDLQTAVNNLESGSNVFLATGAAAGAVTLAGDLGGSAALPQVTATHLAAALPILQGGTGQSTAGAAFNALSPLTTAGDLLYGGAAGIGLRLAAGSSTQVLHGGSVPSWGAISLASDVGGTLPILNGGTGATTAGTALTALGTGSSTITGPTTFNAGAFLDKGNQVFNVRAYGAVGDGVTNDNTAVALAVAAGNATNEPFILLFPQGYNFVLSPSIQISNNTHISNQGIITLDTNYVNTTTVFKGIFRLGGTGGTDVIDNVEIEGGLFNSDCFSSGLATSSPTFNANNHKYVCYVHSVSTHRNVNIHGFKVYNTGSPVTLEKVGGVNGTPTRNVHIYDIVEEQVWVGVQFYCNGWLYEDCSVHDIDVKYCYDDCVAIVGSAGGTGGTGIARRINVYNIRGEKTGQTGAGVKLDATGGYLSDINVYGINLSTAGVNEYPTSIIGASAANNKKFNFWGIQCSGTWAYGLYAQTNGRHIQYTNFKIEALNGLHFQANSVPDHYQSILIANGVVMSRNASAADTIEGNGISYSASTGSQGFQNVRVRNVSFFDKAIPINEGATVPSGTGVQGTYANFDYDVDFRDKALGDCALSATASRMRYSQNGLYGTETAPTFATALTVVNGGTGATSLTGLIKGNGTSSMTAATAGTDYLAPAGNGSALTGITESQVTNLISDLAAKAPIASPTFTGVVTVPTNGLVVGTTQLITASGKVGVGVSPSEVLHIKGGNVTGLRIESSGNAPILDLYSAGDRNFSVRANYNTNGILDFLRSTTSGGAPTTLMMQMDGTTGNLIHAEGTNVQLGTGTGTKFGTSILQKLSFFNSTPIIQPTGDVAAALSSLGLVSSPTILASRVVGTGTAPTIAAGAGAGTSPTVSLTGHDVAGQISITTGTLPTLNASIFTATFNTAFSTAPYVVFVPANSNAALLSGAGMVYVTSTTTTFGFTAGATALTATTTYLWNYQVIG